MTFPIPGKVEGVATARKTVMEIKNAWLRYPAAEAYALRAVCGNRKGTNGVCTNGVTANFNFV